MLAPLLMAAATRDNGGMHNTSAALPRLILGSSSPYRRELLSRLQWPFEVRAPEVDEAALPGEVPADLALRLAWAKARAVCAGLARAEDQGDTIVIGSDQVADLHGHALGKPGSHGGAVEQLRAMSGQALRFHTAVVVMRGLTGFEQQLVSTVEVYVRVLSDAEIEGYLQLEQPYDCAGSAKAEGLGIALLDEIRSNDPTALIGLPLIGVARMLREAGLNVLAGARP